MKRAFLVLGVECSGTRMLTQTLISAGCEGSAEHAQPFDDFDFTRATTERIVFRRSFPHGGVWPELKRIAIAMNSAGFRVTPLLLYRKTDCVLRSQEKRYRETGMGRPSEEIRRALGWAVLMGVSEAYELADFLAEPLVVVPYEPFVLLPEVRAALFGSLGLPAPQGEFYNANEAYELEGALTW